MAYVKETWTDGSGNAIDAASLAHMETQYDEVMAESVAAPTANKLIKRDAAGRAQVVDPSVAADIATKGYVDTAAGGRAPLDSPTFTGNPTAPTPAAADNDTSIATTAFVKTAVAAGGGGGLVLGPVRPPINTWLVPSRTTAYSTNDASAFGNTYSGALTMEVPRAVTIDALIFRVTTAAAGVSVGAAVWAAGADGLPATLVAHAVGSGAATGVIQVMLAAPVALPAGLYFTGAAVSSPGSIRLAVAWENQLHSVFDPSQISNTIPTDVQSRRWSVASGGNWDAPAATITGTWYSGGSFGVLVGMRRSA